MLWLNLLKAPSRAAMYDRQSSARSGSVLSKLLRKLPLPFSSKKVSKEESQSECTRPVSNKKTLRVKYLFSRKSRQVHPCVPVHVVTVKPADQSETVGYSMTCETVRTNTPARRTCTRPKTARPPSSHHSKTLPSITAFEHRRMCTKTLKERPSSQAVPEHSTPRPTPKERCSSQPLPECNTPTFYSISKLQEMFAGLDVPVSQVQLCDGYYMDAYPKTSGGHAYDLIFSHATRPRPERRNSKLNKDGSLSQKDSLESIISFQSLSLDLSDDKWSSDSDDDCNKREDPIGCKQLGTPHKVSMHFTPLADQNLMTSQSKKLESVKVERKPKFFTAAKPPLHPSAWKRIQEYKNQQAQRYF